MNNDASMFRTGDLVIGSSDSTKSVYSSTGAKIIPDGAVIYGKQSDVDAQQRDIVSSLVRNGGKPISMDGQKRPGKKAQRSYKHKKAASSAYIDYSTVDYQSEHKLKTTEVEAAPIQRLTTVQFENSFGKIKAKVEHVIEHEQAFLLVFTDEDAVVFEPKTGETLVLHIQEQHDSYEVYYPGVTFNSPDSSKKLMILFKIPVDTEQ
jgi:hypothetical protein